MYDSRDNVTCDQIEMTRSPAISRGDVDLSPPANGQLFSTKASNTSISKYQAMETIRRPNHAPGRIALHAR